MKKMNNNCVENMDEEENEMLTITKTNVFLLYSFRRVNDCVNLIIIYNNLYFAMIFINSFFYKRNY